MIFDILLIGVMAAASLYYGLKPLLQHRKLEKNGVCVTAHVVGEGENQNGRFQVLAFEANGTSHRLNYPMPRRRSLPEGDITLYYDPYHPEHLAVKGDKTNLMGSVFCLILGTALIIIGLYIIF